MIQHQLLYTTLSSNTAHSCASKILTETTIKLGKYNKSDFITTVAPEHTTITNNC